MPSLRSAVGNNQRLLRAEAPQIDSTRVVSVENNLQDALFLARQYCIHWLLLTAFWHVLGILSLRESRHASRRMTVRAYLMHGVGVLVVLSRVVAGPL